MTASTGRPGVAVLVHPPAQAPIHVHIGSAIIEHGVAIDDTTTFNIGSVAKQFTAHLVTLAARQHLLSLDDPAQRYLPRLRIPDVTIADLLCHYGGIRDAESLLSLVGFRDLDHYTNDDLLELAYRQTQRAVPAGRFLYSNTGYLLLAAILHTVHGDAELPEIARRQLFGPLHMTTATFKHSPREVIAGAAASYRHAIDGWEHGQAPVALPGPGSLWCTTTDLDRWLGHLHDQWRTPSALPFDRELAYRSSDHAPYLYGLGLYADPRPNREVVFHHGHEHGFSAAAHLTGTGLRVIALSNHAGISADLVTASILTAMRTDTPDLEELVQREFNKQRPTEPLKPRPDEYAELDETDDVELGTFTCTDVPGSLRLTRTGDTLSLWRRGTRDRLTPTSPTTYAADGYTLTLDVAPSTSRHDGFTLDLQRAPGLRYRATSFVARL